MKRRLFIWSIISAVLILLFTTRSSVLFVCNNWDDANSYFTMGKGMMHGLVIYRDLYDQKGPFLYLLYGLAYLISEKTFFGVFIFEIIAATFFLYFAGRVIERRSNEVLALILVPVLSACVYSSWSFYFGGGAEEFCLPFFAYSMYALDLILHKEFDEKLIAKRMAFVALCAGVTAQVKYTMLGFYVAWFVIVFIWIAIKKDIVFALKQTLKFILFALIPSIPWMIYFLATGSLDDWFRCYIYNNIFHYSQVTTEEYSFFTKLYEMSKTLYWLIRDSFSYFILIIAGLILQLVLEKGFIRRFTSLFIFGVTYFVIFIGGNKLAYYSIPLMALAIPGISYIAELLVRVFGNLKEKKIGVVPVVIMLGVLAISTVFAANNTMNAEYRGFSKEDVWLVDAAKYLTKDDTLLELNAIDAGLYTVTGIVPTCEYFQTNGLDLETMFIEQKKYLKEGRTDYVLAVGFEPEFIHEHYSLMAVYDYNETHHEETYYLYRRNDHG
ncbi:MAG: hypothetical protein IJU77_10380 [Butyrivibrio sp.]|nr:hypothetical protein [Butyrivibrio sp.]